MELWRDNILRFIVLLLLQLLLINNLHFLGLCHPCFYILFLILLPQTMPRWVELLIGFATGLIMDIACNSLGVHSSACTMLAFVRPIFLNKLSLDKKQVLSEPSIQSLGFMVYLKMVLFLVFLHHTIVFSLSAFTWNNWWITLLQICVSSIVTTGLIILYDILLHRS